MHRKEALSHGLKMTLRLSLVQAILVSLILRSILRLTPSTPMNWRLLSSSNCAFCFVEDGVTTIRPIRILFLLRTLLLLARELISIWLLRSASISLWIHWRILRSNTTILFLSYTLSRRRRIWTLLVKSATWRNLWLIPVFARWNWI